MTGAGWRRRPATLAAIAVAGWTALLYARVSSHPFIHFDDNRYLLEKSDRSHVVL